MIVGTLSNWFITEASSDEIKFDDFYFSKSKSALDLPHYGVAYANEASGCDMYF